MERIFRFRNLASVAVSLLLTSGCLVGGGGGGGVPAQVVGVQAIVFDDHVRIAWSPARGAARYHVEYAVGNMNAVYGNRTVVSENFLDWRYDASGIYYFRIRGVSEAGKTGPWSEPELVQIPNDDTAGGSSDDSGGSGDVTDNTGDTGNSGGDATGGSGGNTPDPRYGLALTAAPSVTRYATLLIAGQATGTDTPYSYRLYIDGQLKSQLTARR